MTTTDQDSLPAALAVRPLVGRRLKPIGLDDDYACESMGSWLLRTARHNGFEALATLLQETGYYNVHLDIPRNPGKYVRSIALATGRSMDEIRRMLLGKCDVDARHDFSVRPWVLSARDQRHQQRDGMRHVVCLQCLHGDAEPYWRKYWRFSFSTVCRVHGTLLQELCSYCRGHFVIDAWSINSARACGKCHQAHVQPEPTEQRFEHGPVEKMLSRVFVEGRTAKLLEDTGRSHQRLNLARLVDLLSSPTGQALRDFSSAVSWSKYTGLRGGLMQFYPRLCVRERRRAMDFLEVIIARSPVAFWQLLNFNSTLTNWLDLAKLLLNAPAPMRWGQSTKLEPGESGGPDVVADS